MYDLIPLSMKAQFNSINLSNQSIKLNVSLDEKKSNKKDLSNYTYNKVIIFNYSINLQNSQINLNIYNKTSNKSYFHKIVLGSFVYQTAVKFSSSTIIVNSKNKSDSYHHRPYHIIIISIFSEIIIRIIFHHHHLFQS